jgi:hypothetical protein
MAGAIAFGIAAAGCGAPPEKKTTAEKSTGDKTAQAETGAKSSSGGESSTSTKSSAEKEPLVAKAWGSLKGKVTFDGTPPAEKQVDISMTVKERDDCLKGDTRVQTWKVGKDDKGVGDVVVWLRAPRGKYFEIPEDQQKAEGTMKVDQPHCSFIPHVQVLYPTYYDAKSKKQKPTGQKFEVVNSANFSHNTNYEFSDRLVASGSNQILKAKTGVMPIEARTNRPNKPNTVGGEQKITFKCNIHGWMSGYAWVFDHPYAAVTSGDEIDAKDFGTYEIKKAPAGVELELVYWHETMKQPKVLKTFSLKEGENTEDIKISPASEQ